MKTKQQKRNEARKTAEAKSAAKKAMRDPNAGVAVNPGRNKGRSVIPQSKARKK